MSWNSLDPETRALAEKLCTDRELTALKLWHNGAGYRRIGLILGISMSSARDRVHRATDKIHRAKETHAVVSMDGQDPLRQPDQPSTEAA